MNLCMLFLSASLLYWVVRPSKMIKCDDSQDSGMSRLLNLLPMLSQNTKPLVVPLSLSSLHIWHSTNTPRSTL